MLILKKIKKSYQVGETKQQVLKGININFRQNEFVSILGPSGSGKTTLLNIIGGLDRYDSGDLIINNISTKKYKDKDWDSYRNHTIGFVFQSYNLIPHQSVLKNVELALTIGGINANERKKRALDALEQVGLKTQAYKRPNQLSGGQMQRVAIARALVNNPDILLADEPTGALDTETSIQVMDLIKKIAEKKLVIMVTHNPDLAQAYSTRIIKINDGQITDDSNPYKVNEKEESKYQNLGKSSMSLLTAFELSLNNLLTKKGRTILTAFAGSIGIIGIALILSLSTGFQKYIDKIQEDALSSYPLTITDETSDVTSIILSSAEKSEQKSKDKVIENQNFTEMFTKVGTNDLKYFKKYLEEHDEMTKHTTLIRYSYDVTPFIFTQDVNNKILKVNPSNLFSSFMTTSISTMSMSLFTELNENKDLLSSQYNLFKGKYPEAYDEILLILPSENTISDLLLYGIGLRDVNEFDKMVNNLINNETVDIKNEPLEFTYDELMNIDLRVIDGSNLYKYNADYNIYEDMSEDNTYMHNLYENSTKLKIVGIATIDSGSSLTSGIGYTKALTEHVINNAANSEIVKKQLDNKEINIFNNKRFDDTSNDTGIDFNNLISVNTNLLSEAFNMKIDENEIRSLTDGYMLEISNAITADISNAKEQYLTTLSSLIKNMLTEYLKDNGTNSIAFIKAEQIPELINNYLETDNAKAYLTNLENNYVITVDAFKSIYNPTINGILTTYVSMADTGSGAIINEQIINTISTTLLEDEKINEASNTIAQKMTEANMNKVILTKVGELTAQLVTKIASSFNVDSNKIASAFSFNLTEDDLKRIFSAMTSSTTTNLTNNLLKLGYQDIESPSSIYFYFKDFDSKEAFVSLLKDYNQKMESEDENKVIKYTDITAILISSVKVIVDSVSYVLIAFVSISLIVSSIMIGIITYISVLERTKEIGILRSIGASKRNISSIFNAETFIIGFLSGVLGIITSLILLIPINIVIHSVANEDITAQLPIQGAITLIILSTILTLIGGLIPSKSAAKKDPVDALRTE